MAPYTIGESTACSFEIPPIRLTRVSLFRFFSPNKKKTPFPFLISQISPPISYVNWRRRYAPLHDSHASIDVTPPREISTRSTHSTYSPRLLWRGGGPCHRATRGGATVLPVRNGRFLGPRPARRILMQPRRRVPSKSPHSASVHSARRLAATSLRSCARSLHDLRGFPPKGFAFLRRISAPTRVAHGHLGHSSRRTARLFGPPVREPR